MPGPLAFVMIICLAGPQFSLKSQTATAHSYYVVQGEDTLTGYYDTLHLADGPFVQYLHTVFSDGLIYSPYAPAGTLNKDGARFVHFDHSVIHGAFLNGAPFGEWLYHLNNFKQFNTCYGDLDWKKVDYTNADTLTIHYWYGSDKVLPGGERIDGERTNNWSIRYQCRDEYCLIESAETGKRWKVPLSELDITLQRIGMWGLDEDVLLVE